MRLASALRLGEKRMNETDRILNERIKDAEHIFLHDTKTDLYNYAWRGEVCDAPDLIIEVDLEDNDELKEVFRTITKSKGMPLQEYMREHNNSWFAH